jgi:5'(3')-deoxyribonucleotidase
VPGIEIYQLLQWLGFNVYILSSCPNTPYSRVEKRAWLRKYMPYIDDKHIIFCDIGSNKAEIARKYAGGDLSKSVLVDDYKVNLQEWRLAGGIAMKKAREIKPRDYLHVNDSSGILNALIDYVKNLN